MPEDATPANVSHHRRTALKWAFAGGACVGIAWAIVLQLARSVLNLEFIPNRLPGGVVGAAATQSALGADYGFVVGIARAVAHPRERRSTSALMWIGCILFGAIGGVLSVLAVAVTTPRVDPIVSSSLAWGAMGFVAGWCSYKFTHRDKPTKSPGGTNPTQA